MNLKIAFCAIASAIIFSACSSSTKISDSDQFQILYNQIDGQFKDSSFAHAHWGALIKSLSTGETWYELNSEKMFMPASNEKILTSSAALMKLRPDFTFNTYLCYEGSVEDSVLAGDLVVVGDGDPTMYSIFFDDPREVFWNWADSLKALGIKKITGNIIGDDNKFDEEFLGDGWSYDGLSAWYSTEISALQLNENYVDLTIEPPLTIDGEVKIIPNLPSAYYNFLNNLTVTDTGFNRVFVDREFGTNDITIDGRVVAGSGEIVRSPSIHNPTKFFVTVLKEVLEEKGIRVDGAPIDCDEVADWEFKEDDENTLIVHKSPPLSEILKVLMKRSQNLYAETMVRAIGLADSGFGSFRNGKKGVEEVLAQFGIEPESYAFRDGSGLSRYNYVSPAQIVKILTEMRFGRYWSLWYDIQPIAGIDGTLRNRMKNSKARNNVHAKTGTISNVRALSGYVTTAEGEEIVFSFLVNGHLLSSRDTERITDTVLDLIANFSND